MGAFVGKISTPISKQLDWQQFNICHGDEHSPLMTAALRPPINFSALSGRHTILYTPSNSTLSYLKVLNPISINILIVSEV